MKTKYFTYGILLLIVGLTFISGCINQQKDQSEPSTLKTEPIDLSGIETEKLSFISYYSLRLITDL